MKNEDRIVELLAESLKRQDQHSELLTKHSELLEKLVDGQLNTNQRLEGVDKRLGALEHKFDKLFEILTTEVYERLEKWEKAVFK